MEAVEISAPDEADIGGCLELGVEIRTRDQKPLDLPIALSFIQEGTMLEIYPDAKCEGTGVYMQQIAAGVQALKTYVRLEKTAELVASAQMTASNLKVVLDHMPKIKPAPAAKVVFSEIPKTVKVGVPFRVKLQVTDRFGNPTADSFDSVPIAIFSGGQKSAEESVRIADGVGEISAFVVDFPSSSTVLKVDFPPLVGESAPFAAMGKIVTSKNLSPLDGDPLARKMVVNFPVELVINGTVLHAMRQGEFYYMNGKKTELHYLGNHRVRVIYNGTELKPTFRIVSIFPRGSTNPSRIVMRIDGGP